MSDVLLANRFYLKNKLKITLVIQKQPQFNLRTIIGMIRMLQYIPDVNIAKH